MEERKSSGIFACVWGQVKFRWQRMNPKSSLTRSNPLRLLSLAAVGGAGLALALSVTVRGAAPAAVAPAAPAAPTAPAAPAAPAAKPATPAKAVTFAEVKPLLEKYCYACHGAAAVTPPQSKGGLSLDTAEHAAAGGRSKKPAIVAGKADASEAIRRIKLAQGEKDIMPQKGKPAPTPEEIQKLVDWVNSGASWK